MGGMAMPVTPSTSVSGARLAHRDDARYAEKAASKIGRPGAS